MVHSGPEDPAELPSSDELITLDLTGLCFLWVPSEIWQEYPCPGADWPGVSPIFFQTQTPQLFLQWNFILGVRIGIALKEFSS